MKTSSTGRLATSLSIAALSLAGLMACARAGDHSSTPSEGHGDVSPLPNQSKESDVTQDIEKATAIIYEEQATPGIICSGGGLYGEWLKRMATEKLRFIRLDHGGRCWDDGMGRTGADVNFLGELSRTMGFRAASKGESVTPEQLARFPGDGFPPFVYITGNGKVGRLSSEDDKKLREYCLRGGMLIIDAGSAEFDRSVRESVRRIFPGWPLVDVSDDDVVYQTPYAFPNGAPAFWHHGGARLMGITREGRWLVLYHPGDMNDAWKSKGYVDVAPEMRQNAFRLGTNLVVYSHFQREAAIDRRKKRPMPEEGPPEQ